MERKKRNDWNEWPDSLVKVTQNIQFVGYQATGTLGRDLIHCGRRPGGYVVIDGERHDIARIHQLTGYSAHADQQGLVEWVRGMGEMPKEIRLVHGEEGAKRALWARFG